MKTDRFFLGATVRELPAEKQGIPGPIQAGRLMAHGLRDVAGWASETTPAKGSLKPFCAERVEWFACYCIDSLASPGGDVSHAPVVAKSKESIWRQTYGMFRR